MQTATFQLGRRLVRLVSIILATASIAAACGSNGGTSVAAADPVGTSEPKVAEPTTQVPAEPEPEPTPRVPAEPEPEAVADPLSMDDGDRITFEVEVVVTESPTQAYALGDVIWQPNCYTLFADGTFYDQGFPEPARPSPGTWENGWDGTRSSYVARASAGAVLAQTGSITTDEATGALSLTAETAVSVSGSLLVRLISTGRQVDRCTPVAN